MTKRNYRLDLFTGATWNEFKTAGAKVSGFRESRWNILQKIIAISRRVLGLPPGVRYSVH